MRWILLLLFGGIGLGALIGGAMWGFKRLPLFQTGVRVTGNVVAQEEVVSTETAGKNLSSSRQVRSFYPVVEFSTESGQQVRFTGSSGGKLKPLIETGAEVEVVYNPSDPLEAEITGFSQFWLGPLVVAGGGLIFMLMGVGGFFLMGRHDRGMDDSLAMAARQQLVFNTEATIIKGKIIRTEERPEKSGRFVFVIRGQRPGVDSQEEFVSDLFPFDPGTRYKGRQVDIHLDPTGKVGDFVNIDQLLPEIMDNRGK